MAAQKSLSGPLCRRAVTNSLLGDDLSGETAFDFGKSYMYSGIYLVSVQNTLISVTEFIEVCPNCDEIGHFYSAQRTKMSTLDKNSFLSSLGGVSITKLQLVFVKSFIVCFLEN